MRLPRLRDDVAARARNGPSAATRAVYEALLRITSARASPQPGAASPAAAPLVGRLAQRSQLAALWRAADEGAAQLVFVTGEPGVGKTRLLDELRSWCAHNGTPSTEARAYPAEGTMAYGMAVAWLRSEPIAARLPRLDRAHLTELARLLPDLLSQMPGLAAPEPLPESEHRQRLFEAVARAILPHGVPLRLVADDLQWCDAQTRTRSGRTWSSRCASRRTSIRRLPPPSASGRLSRPAAWCPRTADPLQRRRPSGTHYGCHLAVRVC